MKLILTEDTAPVFEQPENGIETGLADIIISAINKKWDNIRDINSIILMLKDTNYTEFLPVMEEILEEENNHIGKLQHIIEILTPAASNIDDGKQEAEEIIES